MLFRKKKKQAVSTKKQMVVVEVGSTQNIGKRNQQQDAFGFSDFTDELLCHEIGFLGVLADGMGGLEGGQVASQKAVKNIIDLYTNKALTEPIDTALLRSLEASNELVKQLGREYGSSGNMGTTIVCSVIKEGQLFYACAGDSRIYLVNQWRIHQLNVDHNYGILLDEKADMGIISWEEADNDKQRGHLISYLGIDKLEYISGNKEPLQLYKDDMILMCSDGLTNGLNDYEIHQLIKQYQGQSAQAISEALVNETLKRDLPYQDNVTVVVLKYKGEII